MKRQIWQTVALCSLALALVSGCKDDDKDDESDEGAAEADLEGDCVDISEACHEHDEGSGMSHTCHELAHENDPDACTAMKDACLEACGHEH